MCAKLIEQSNTYKLCELNHFHQACRSLSNKYFGMKQNPRL